MGVSAVGYDMSRGVSTMRRGSGGLRCVLEGVGGRCRRVATVGTVCYFVGMASNGYRTTTTEGSAMQYALRAVVAPEYAPAGDRGYYILVVRTGDYMCAGERVTRSTDMRGWVHRADNGEVWVTLDGAGYVTVGHCAAADWSDLWVWQHRAAVAELRPVEAPAVAL